MLQIIVAVRRGHNRCVQVQCQVERRVYAALKGYIFITSDRGNVVCNMSANFLYIESECFRFTLCSQDDATKLFLVTTQVPKPPKEVIYIIYIYVLIYYYYFLA